MGERYLKIKNEKKLFIVCPLLDTITIHSCQNVIHLFREIKHHEFGANIPQTVESSA